MIKDIWLSQLQMDIIIKQKLSILLYQTRIQKSHIQRVSGETYPINDINKPLTIVSSIKTDNGVGNQNSLYYQYNGAKVHLLGKGFMGFESIDVFDNTTGLETISTNELNRTYCFFRPKKIVNQLATGSKIFNTTYTNAVYNFGNNRIFPYITNIATEDVLKGYTINHVFNYSNTDLVNGNLTYDETQYDPSTTNRNSCEYIQANGVWKISKLTNTKTRYNESNCIRTIDYTYNPDDGLIKDQESDKGKDKALKTSFTYDTYGNPLTITTSANASGLTSRTETLTYDSKARFVETRTNPWDI